MAIATDNVKSTVSPNTWKIKSITLSALVLGMFFAFEDLLLIFIGLHYFHLEFAEIQTLVLLTLVFNTQFRILMVRERKHFWSSAPNRNLLLVNLMTLILFFLIGSTGMIVPKLSAGQVSILLGITLFFMMLMDFLKYHLFRRFGV